MKLNRTGVISPVQHLKDAAIVLQKEYAACRINPVVAADPMIAT